jgi:hypothetical protein
MVVDSSLPLELAEQAHHHVREIFASLLCEQGALVEHRGNHSQLAFGYMLP